LSPEKHGISSGVQLADVPRYLEHLYIKYTRIDRDTAPTAYSVTRLVVLTLIGAQIDEAENPALDAPCLEELNLSKLRIAPCPTLPSLSSDLFWNHRPLLRQHGWFEHLPALKRLWVDSLAFPILWDFTSFPNLVALRMTSCAHWKGPLGVLKGDIAAASELKEIVLPLMNDNDLLARKLMHDCISERPHLRILTNEAESRHPFTIGLPRGALRDDESLDLDPFIFSCRK
jgi:hypothetical protein